MFFRKLKEQFSSDQIFQELRWDKLAIDTVNMRFGVVQMRIDQHALQWWLFFLTRKRADLSYLKPVLIDNVYDVNSSLASFFIFQMRLNLEFYSLQNVFSFKFTFKSTILRQKSKQKNGNTIQRIQTFHFPVLLLEYKLVRNDMLHLSFT